MVEDVPAGAPKRPVKKRPVKSVPAGATRLSPPQIAQRLQVSPETVIAEIRAGRLRAIDLARPGSRRPRYRIAVEDLEAFENRRTVVTPAKLPVRPRRDQGVARFY